MVIRARAFPTGLVAMALPGPRNTGGALGEPCPVDLGCLSKAAPGSEVLQKTRHSAWASTRVPGHSYTKVVLGSSCLSGRLSLTTGVCFSVHTAGWKGSATTSPECPSTSEATVPLVAQPGHTPVAPA